MTASLGTPAAPFGGGGGPDDFTDLLRKRAREALSAKAKEAADLDEEMRELDLQKSRSEQDLRRQIVDFRKLLLWYLIGFMTLETIALYTIVILTSLKILTIEPATLQILVGATIAEISAMLIVIVRSVYSNSLNKIIMSKDPVLISR